MRPPPKNDQKWTQNGCKCMTFGASSLGLFGLTFLLKIVIGAKTLKHTLHAKHHCMPVDTSSNFSGRSGYWTYWNTHFLFRGMVAVSALAPLDNILKLVDADNNSIKIQYFQIYYIANMPDRFIYGSEKNVIIIYKHRLKYQILV